METLHIYSQEIWHDEAYIAGTHEALTLLRDAIDAALKTGTGRAECFVCDGEGYWVEVVATDDEKMDKMAVPYTDPVAMASAGDNFGPWSLLRPNEKVTGSPASSASPCGLPSSASCERRLLRRQETWDANNADARTIRSTNRAKIGPANRQ